MSTVGRFAKVKKLGGGTYGVVYLARDVNTGEYFALKRMVGATEDEGVPSTAIREVAIQQELAHPNIVRLDEVLFDDLKLTLVFEYCEFDLQKLIYHCKRDLPPALIQALMHQLLSGLDYLHSHSVVHRDLKSPNLMIKLIREHHSEDVRMNEYELKIGDFGLARVDGISVKKYSHEAVTLWYRSPDAVCGSTTYGHDIDMWSVGCILYELAVGEPPFRGDTPQKQLEEIFNKLGPPDPKRELPELLRYTSGPTLLDKLNNIGWGRKRRAALRKTVEATLLPKLGKSGVDLLMSLLQYHPKRRPTAKHALKHHYFSKKRLMSTSSSLILLELQTRLQTAAARFADYNFRHYFQDWVNDKLNEVKQRTDNEQRTFIEVEGPKLAEQMERMALINGLYATTQVEIDDKSV